MYEKWINVLEQAPLFMEIPGADVVRMLEQLWPRLEMYRKDEFVILTGDEVKAAGLVLSGRLAVVKENAAGQQMMVTVLEPGDMLGEVAVFSGIGNWPSSVRTLVESVVVYLTVEQLTRAAVPGWVHHPQMMGNLLHILAQKALVLNKKVDYLSLKTVRGKVCALLLEHWQKTEQARFTLPMNREEMALFLNIPRPSLSRELGALRDEGIVSFERSEFVIADPARLKKSIS